MASRQFAWVTHAPADYMLVFREGCDGEHAVVSARFEGEGEAVAAGRGLEGAELSDHELCVYCTLADEPDVVRTHLERAFAPELRVERGEIAFVAAGGGATAPDAVRARKDGAPRVVVGADGDGPRCYRFSSQCRRCGELLGKINVLPRGGMRLDTRELSCRCDSFPCRYCAEGTVRRPMTEHFDPERRAGWMPAFGLLVPCGGCQGAGRGPRIQMSI